MRRSKYRAVPTVVDNVRFASKREALYYMQLKALLNAGRIKDLELQPKFKIPPTGELICTYCGDFKVTYPDGHSVVYEVKGFATPVWKLKKKLMKHFWPSVELVVV